MKKIFIETKKYIGGWSNILIEVDYFTCDHPDFYPDPIEGRLKFYPIVQHGDTHYAVLTPAPITTDKYRGDKEFIERGVKFINDAPDKTFGGDKLVTLGSCNQPLFMVHTRNSSEIILTSFGRNFNGAFVINFDEALSNDGVGKYTNLFEKNGKEHEYKLVPLSELGLTINR